MIHIKGTAGKAYEGKNADQDKGQHFFVYRKGLSTYFQIPDKSKLGT